MYSTIGSGTASQATPQGRRHDRAEVGFTLSENVSDSLITAKKKMTIGHLAAPPDWPDWALAAWATDGGPNWVQGSRIISGTPVPSTEEFKPYPGHAAD